MQEGIWAVSRDWGLGNPKGGGNKKDA